MGGSFSAVGGGVSQQGVKTQMQKVKKEKVQKVQKVVGQMDMSQEIESEEDILRKKSKIIENARSQKFHYLLPINVQQALKNVILQHANNELQKNIMINDVIERAVHEYPDYFKSGNY